MRSAFERVRAYVNASAQMSATHKGTPHESNGEPLHLADLRALLALYEACQAMEAARKASAQFEDDFWGTPVDMTVAEYRKQSDVLCSAHVAAVEAFRAALAALTQEPS